MSGWFAAIVLAWAALLAIEGQFRAALVPALIGAVIALVARHRRSEVRA